jgi:hypothetical protein
MWPSDNDLEVGFFVGHELKTKSFLTIGGASAAPFIELNSITK